MTTKRTNPKSKARRVSHVSAKRGGVVGARRRKTVSDAINFERLETRQLMSSVNVADFGAVANDGKDDRAAIQAALNGAANGDTIVFGAGQYDINGSLNMPSNRTLTGAANHASKLVFKTGNTAYGINANSVSNVTIDGLAIQANDGVILAGGNISNFKLTNDDFVWGYDGSYYNRLVLHQTGSANGLVIEHNNFHDSTSSDRNVDLYNVSNSSYSYNTFHLVNDGGHMDGTTTNFKFVGNVATGIHRMGLELQDHDTTDAGGNNILIADNVFTDWYKPFWESFALSIPPQHAKNVTIRNNYLSVFAYGKTSPNSGWGQADSSGTNRPGYGIEVSVGGESVADAATCITEGNTLVGPWITAIVFGEPGTQLKNNKTYGSNPWGAWAGEGGLNPGGGSMKDLGGNQAGMPISQAPQPQSGMTGSPEVPVPVATGVTAKVLSNSSVQLNWTKPKTLPASYRIDIVSTVSRDSFQSVTVKGTATSVVINNMTPGWEIDFAVVSVTASGEGSATPVTVHMTGSAPGGPVGGNPSAGAVDVTKLKLESGSNGWGEYEIDQSNGEASSGDGKTLSLRGTTYAKGFGVHAPSALVVKLDGKYTSFASLIGIDDETAGKGSVIFRVYGDGKKLFDSGDVTGTDAARKINIDVTGVMKLKLVVVSSDGSINNDHADWVNPLLVRGTGTGVGSAPRNKKRYLQNARLVSSENKLDDPRINESAGGGTQTINGTHYTKGVGVTAASKLVYALGGKYTTFCSYIGLDDATTRGSATFQVWGDGHLLYDSGTVNSTSRMRKVKVNVTGVNQLWLKVTPATGGVKNATVHADWAQSYLIAA